MEELIEELNAKPQMNHLHSEAEEDNNGKRQELIQSRVRMVE